MITILGIETSCDETAAAVVEDGRTLRSNVVASQIDLHRRYGGVFPEMASRQHVLAITPVIREAMAQAGKDWDDLDAIAVTEGPGLAGSLLVGLNAAKGLSLARGIPLVGVNHLESHIYANWLPTGDDAANGAAKAVAEAAAFVPPPLPLVCLVVSGGHTDLILMREHHDYTLLGRTIDDAAGEAFDKVARLLGLGYPGGPAIQRAAEGGDPTAYDLPRALDVGPFDFSFSGLKTAVLRLVQELRRERGEEVAERGEKLAEAALTGNSDDLPIADLAASFQAAVVDALVTKTAEAVERYDAAQVLIAGGVAANVLLRTEMRRRVPVPVRYPPIHFCTDNAAMVAMAGYYLYVAGKRSDLSLDVVPSLRLV